MDPNRIIELAKKTRQLAMDVEYLGHMSVRKRGFKLHGISFAVRDGDQIVGDYITDIAEAARIYRAVYDYVAITGHNFKSDLIAMARDPIFQLQPDEYPVYMRDSLIAKNLLDESLFEGDLGLKALVHAEFGYVMMNYMEASDGGTDLDSEKFYKYATDDSIWQLKLWEKYGPQLREQDFWGYYTNILMPASNVFVDIDMTGYAYNADKALEQYHQFVKIKNETEAELFKRIGIVNLDSPKALAKRLYDDLGYTVASLPLTKGGKAKKAAGKPLIYSDYSTDGKAIEKLERRYPVCKLISYHRTASKAITTYLEPAMQQIAENREPRVFGDSNFVTSTGRMSCRNYPLQTVPTFLGDFDDKNNPFTKIKIRDAFVPDKDWIMHVYDFSQIELRVAGVVYNDRVFLAAYRNYVCSMCGASGASNQILHACPKCGISEDEDAMKGKVKGFWHGLDLHSDLANKVPALKGDRQNAKAGNFALIFNATPWTMHVNNPSASPDEWEEISKGFFKLHPETKRYHNYIEKVVSTTREVRNIYKRRRRLSKREVQMSQKHCVNQLVNFPVQSVPASMIQHVVVNLKEKWLKDKIWMNAVKIPNVIHDELVVLQHKDLVRDIGTEIQWEMENILNIGVPIRAEGGQVPNWGSAK